MASQQQVSSSFESRQMVQQTTNHTTTATHQSFAAANQQQANMELYEAAEFGGGVMKGYKPKGAASLLQNGGGGSNGHLAQSEEAHAQHGQFLRDTGIFGGITGDHNSLQEEDEEFDYKKHSVKSLVGHFSKVKYGFKKYVLLLNK